MYEISGEFEIQLDLKCQIFTAGQLLLPAAILLQVPSLLLAEFFLLAALEYVFVTAPQDFRWEALVQKLLYVALA